MQAAEGSIETSTAPQYAEWSTVDHIRPADSAGTKSNTMDLDRIMSGSEYNNGRTPTEFSMDDLEVAKALTGLREASPAQSTSTLTSQTLKSQSPPLQHSQTQPEPLLSLLTSQHPLVATAITNSLSAYTSSKTYSPRFRQGAEFVERNIASPVVNTVGTAGRLSGVETGVRWWLQRRGSSNEAEKANKRQRIDKDFDDMDVERAIPHRSRAPSDFSQPEYLPPYDSNRSPVYEEYAVAHSPRNGTEQAPALQNWQTRFMMSTSGLGVAMSEESLRSLKYCLSWLRWANNHLNNVLASLQTVLCEWERSQAQSSSRHSASPGSPMSPGNTTSSHADSNSERPPRDQAVIVSHLTALKAECVKTLKNAFDVVSTYAGGALPENARALVRRHLTSLPLRFRLANGVNDTNAAPNGVADPESQAKAPDVVSGAQRVVVLAQEGLDMMSQVSGVVNGTIVSAEEWCDRLGRRRPDDRNGNSEKMDGDDQDGVSSSFGERKDITMMGSEKL